MSATADEVKELEERVAAKLACAKANREVAGRLESEAAALSAQIAAAKSPPKSRWEQRAETVISEVPGGYVWFGKLVFDNSDPAWLVPLLRAALASELSAAAESGKAEGEFNHENLMKALMEMTGAECNELYDLFNAVPWGEKHDEYTARCVTNYLVSAFHRTKGVGDA